MGKVISDVDSSNFAPNAQIKVDGASLTGILKNRREIKTKFGMKSIFVLEAVDAECKFMRGTEEVFPQPGEKVEIMPPTRLERQLNQVPMGSKVLIKYLGKKATGGPNAAHVFHVEVL
jgi:hypothetical protein